MIESHAHDVRGYGPTETKGIRRYPNRASKIGAGKLSFAMARVLVMKKAFGSQRGSQSNWIRNRQLQLGAWPQAERVKRHRRRTVQHRLWDAIGQPMDYLSNGPERIEESGTPAARIVDVAHTASLYRPRIARESLKCSCQYISVGRVGRGSLMRTLLLVQMTLILRLM
jgi:hypothetical protein